MVSSPAAQEEPVPSAPQTHLDTFDNPAPGRDYLIAFACPEFTCLCPLTGQPDFARLAVRYVADARCVELKSLKLYLWSYRDRGAFHEKVTNTILDDMVATIAPRFCEVRGEFFVRGGIATTVVARHGQVPPALADVLARPPAELFS
jgi:7-cyano-7-deazaguanine reductase